jgi:D-alanyl-lipoteichoic acid acyltransferase DltB (MBOAT superfamily)
MTFTTITFALFFIIVFGVYWSIRNKTWQNVFLLAASYIFYGWWDYRFCGLLLLTSLIDYTVARLLENAEEPRHRRRLLLISLISNLGVLGIFKYLDFFAANFQALLNSLGFDASPFTLNVVLPVGISFYTFQSLNYTIDVYRRELKPSANLIEFLAFVSYFPHLIAGPINRAKDLLTQIEAPRRFDPAQAVDGCRQMLWGAVKKALIADNLASIVEAAYNEPGRHAGPQLAFATVCFALQIYCDFSGYSDIALGCSNVLGIRLMRNFAYPYFSQSLSEFWHRWHISLSTWFRDYLYIPLGGSRRGAWRRTANLMITFFLSGLWHGAAWHYVVWGTINGAGLAMETTAASLRRDPARSDRKVLVLAKIARVGATFSFICVGWVFFRANSVTDAFSILQRMATMSYSAANWAPLLSSLLDHRVIVIGAAGLMAVEWIRRKYSHPLYFAMNGIQSRWMSGGLTVFRWAVYTLLVFAICQYAPFRGREFIYFQF